MKKLSPLFIALVLLTFAASAAAHELGIARLVDAPAGPYLVSVWTDPDPARVGTVHATVAILDPETNDNVLNATIEVTLVSEQTGDTTTVFATHDQAINRLMYEAQLQPEAEGQYRVTVAVDGPLGAGAPVSFEMEVLQAATTNWGLIGGGAAVLMVALWLFLGRRRAN